jgi:hypothetical protein
MKKYDFVIPLKIDESIWGDNKELKYLLRSVEQNFPVNRVIIVASKLPGWLNKDEVVFIEKNDPFNHHKDANIILKLLMAATHVTDITSTFFWSCDDHLVLRKPKPGELIPMFISDLNNEQSWWWSGKWKQGMRNTKDYLEKNDCSTYHYDVHVPQPIDRDKAIEIFDRVKLENHNRYCVNTLYFNQAGLKKHHHIGILKSTFENPESEISVIETDCFNRLYLGYNDSGLTPQLQQFIVNKFVNPSKYEL